MKHLNYLWLAGFACLASCSSEEYLGEQSLTQNGMKEISFAKKSPNITRADPGLETETGTFKVYGVKKVDTDKYGQVFGNYAVWHANDVNTASRPYYWEYVGDNGTSVDVYTGTAAEGSMTSPTSFTLDKKQTIKYWDFSAADYMFWAVAPYDATNVTFTTGTNGDVSSAALTGVGGHLNAVSGSTPTTYKSYYLAKPVTVLSSEQATNISNPVTFTFERTFAKVRVGVYETIPGYSVKSINFYTMADADATLTKATNGNIILNRTDKKFVGGTGNMTVTYTNDHTKSNSTDGCTNDYTFAYTSVTESKNWYGGALPYEADASVADATATLATSSTDTKLWGTDADLATDKYFTVLPTPSGTTAEPITIKCDYTLVSEDGSKEIIHVKGATATIPSTYTTWEPNHAYTYLFKISDNTNGTTGNTPGTDPTGLYPITFDAVVTDIADATEGYLTTVSTLSITATQGGNVVGDGLTFKTNEAIKLKVMQGDTDVTGVATISAQYLEGAAAYKYTKTPEQNATSLANQTATDGVVTLTAQSNEGYWVIKVTKDSATSYLILHVGAADDK